MSRLVCFLVIVVLFFDNVSGQDSLMYQKGLSFSQEYQYDSAKAYLEFAASDKSAIGKKEKGIANYYLRRVFWDQNDFATAFQKGDEALSIFKEINDNYWLGYTLYDLCMANLIQGSYDVALVQAQDSYDAFESVPDTTMMIWSMARRGIVFHDIGEYDEGIKVCNQAQDIFDAFSGKNADIQAMIWGITAINFDDGGRSDKAVDLYLQVLDLENQLSSNREIVRTYNNMGNSLMKLGRLEEAEKYLLLNLEANEKAGFQYGIATVKTNLGTIAYRQGNFSKAETLLEEASEISYSINDAEKILDVLQQKHFLYEQKNDLAQSLEYLKKYHSTKDSLYNLDKQRQIRFLETQFETEKKEQQIALQEAEIEEQEAIIQRNRIALISAITALLLLTVIGLLWRNRIKKKQQIRIQAERLKTREAEINATIASQEKERARYARDLHDGFGQMISVLNLNLKSLKEGATPNERQEVFEASSKVIDEMYGELKNICFDLMPQTLIQSGLASGLSEFAERVNKSGKVFVETSFFGLEDRLQELQEISLYRISQEWINNILKYSDADKITLQLTMDESEITLLIEDNGTGFEKSLLTSSKGNGWKNLNTRANLIQGELELETVPHVKGSTLILNAPSHLPITRKENTMKTV